MEGVRSLAWPETRPGIGTPAYAGLAASPPATINPLVTSGISLRAAPIEILPRSRQRLNTYLRSGGGAPRRIPIKQPSVLSADKYISTYAICTIRRYRFFTGASAH